MLAFGTYKECPSCGSENHSVEFYINKTSKPIETVSYLGTNQSLTYPCGPQLHYKCLVCGYKWITKTKTEL